MVVTKTIDVGAKVNMTDVPANIAYTGNGDGTATVPFRYANRCGKNPESRQARDIMSARGSVLSFHEGDTTLLHGPFRPATVKFVEDKLGIKADYWSNMNKAVVFSGTPRKERGVVGALADIGVSVTSAMNRAIGVASNRMELVKEAASVAIDNGYRVPSDFRNNRTYYDHQVNSILAIADRGTCLLGHDTGLGKTGIFIGGYLSKLQYASDNDLPIPGPLVIVSKKSLIPGLVNEIGEWCGEMNPEVVKGRKAQAINENTDIIISTPDLLQYRIDDIIDADPSGVVFDESHWYKTPDAKRTVAARSLADYIRKHADNPYIICASATPAPNRPEELWAQLVILGRDKEMREHIDKFQRMPDRVAWKKKGSRKYMTRMTNKRAFEIRYCAAFASWLGWDAKGSSNEGELRDFLYDKVMIRLMKEDVMSPMPSLDQHFIKCDFTDEEMSKYEVLENNYIRYASEKVIRKGKSDGLTKKDIEKELQRMNKKVDSAEAVMALTDARVYAANVKTRGLVEWIHRFMSGDESITGGDPERRKLIVFLHFKEVQELVINHPELQKYGVEHIIAGMKDDEINDAVSRFQAKDQLSPRLIICYSGASEGVTLTAAYDVVTEPSWGYAESIQRAGRCWARFSVDYEPHDAHLWYLVSDTKIDKYMIGLVHNKRKTIDKVMNITDDPIEEDDTSLRSFTASMILGDMSSKGKNDRK